MTTNTTPAKPSIPNEDLFSNPFGEEELIPVQQTQEAPVDVATKGPNQDVYNLLNDNEQKQALALAKEITFDKQHSISNYGEKAQMNVTSFSKQMLSKVDSEDVGPVGEILNDLMLTLKDSRPNDFNKKTGFLDKIFNRSKRKLYEIQSKYESIDSKVTGITKELNKHKSALQTDNQMLEQLYGQNLDYFKALNVYIAAGQLKLKELNDNVIPEMKTKATESGDQMDIQLVNDYTQFANRLEKRVYDLELARQITIQQAPQIRIIQNTNQSLVERIQSSLVTAIPLWQNQLALTLTLYRQANAASTTKIVSDTTNEIMKENARLLNQSSIQSAEESERGLVDIETLQETQSSIISTIEDTLRIQQEGKEKRASARIELNRMEQEMKEKLLEFSQK